jgi:hypothetical protein
MVCTQQSDLIPLMVSFGLAEAVQSGLIENLRNLGVRRTEDLQFLTEIDVSKRLALPLMDKRKLLCLLSSWNASFRAYDQQVRSPKHSSMNYGQESQDAGIMNMILQCSKFLRN